MKNFITITAILFCFTANTQVKVYHIIKTNSNIYDKDLQAFLGWGEWHDAIYSSSYSYSYFKYSFSQNAAKKSNYYENIGGNNKVYVSTSDCVNSFIADEPTEDFPFRKKVSIKCTHYLNNPDKPEQNINKETTGTGYIYSATPYDRIMEGNAETEIYVYFEMDDGFIGYEGSYINKHTKAELDESQAEAEDAIAEAEEEAEAERQEQQQRTNHNIKVIGNVLKDLLE